MERKLPVRTRSTTGLAIAEPPTPPAGTSAIDAQLEHLQAQLEKLHAQVRQAQQLSSLGRAAATIAHEVANFLTPIRAYAQAALDADDLGLAKKALTVTLRNVHILINMSEHVLEISAASPPVREVVSVRTVVNDAHASLCRDLSKDGIRFIVDVEESIRVRVDPLQLQQILFNLLLNAREAMEGNHNGRIVVSAKRQGDQVVIEVRNTGEPIPPDLLPDIFTPFQTSKPAEREGRKRCGGLGLALCRDLIEENGGTINVTSDLETGTTFTITLPQSDAASD